MIKMILCSDINGGIGFHNDLLYNIKEDMRFFKETTTGHKIVMGYNTWLSLPKKPLPNRENYVLYDGPEDIEGAEKLKSIQDVVELAKQDDIFIIGGAMVYNQFISLDLVDEVYLTYVYDKHYSANKFVNLIEMSKKLKQREFIKEIEFSDRRGPISVHVYKYYK